MRHNSTKQLLKKFPIFKNLTDLELDNVLNIAQERFFRQGTFIFMQDEPLTNVYFVLSGKIKIYRTDLQGKEQIVNIITVGQMFPHQGFFRDDNYPAHAEIIEEGILVNIPIKKFEQFLISHPKITIKVLRVLGNAIVDLQERLEEQIFNNTYEQIILLLLRLAKSHGKELQDNQIKINTHFTNKDLANMIGSSRETVSRTLSQLKKKQLISTDKSGFVTINPNSLQSELF